MPSDSLFLGINAFCHDSSATIVDGSGQVVAAAEEERFSRRKREGRFPVEAVKYCITAAGAGAKDLTGIGFGWNPYHILFGRLMVSHVLEYPVGPTVFMGTVKQLNEMLTLRKQVTRCVGMLSRDCQIANFRHHEAHAASAYFASPFEDAAFLTVDGRGERECLTWGVAKGGQLRQVGQWFFPHSIGKLYSAVSRFLGFDGGEKDGTVMALAAYGEPRLSDKFAELVRWDPHGVVGKLRLSLEYFDLVDVARASPKLSALLGFPPRNRNDQLTDSHRDLAATLQHSVQDILVFVAKQIRESTRLDRLVMAGGVALNTVANGLIAERSGFKEVFIQPASHDGGLSLGAAYMLASRDRHDRLPRSMWSAALGPEYSDSAIVSELTKHSCLSVTETTQPAVEAARLIAGGKIISWFQGRLEFGPRALGQRCILADPRISNTKKRLNEIKGREDFRPFAAAILSEYRTSWLSTGAESPFMLLVDHIRPERREHVPGILHIDNSVRVQTVEKRTLPLFYELILEFYGLTGVPIVVSTSLNLKGEPIVCHPQEAVQVLLNSTIDVLIIGHYLVSPADRTTR